MNYDLNIITRSQIPSHIYLCDNTYNNDWAMIHRFDFENGLMYIIGSHNPINSPTDIIENMEYDIRTVLNCTNPDELQEYYEDEFGMHYKYKDCVKIWNYYHDNQHLINQVINSYNNTNQEVDEGIETEDDA